MDASFLEYILKYFIVSKRIIIYNNKKTYRLITERNKIQRKITKYLLN